MTFTSKVFLHIDYWTGAILQAVVAGFCGSFSSPERGNGGSADLQNVRFSRKSYGRSSLNSLQLTASLTFRGRSEMCTWLCLGSFTDSHHIFSPGRVGVLGGFSWKPNCMMQPRKNSARRRQMGLKKTIWQSCGKSCGHAKPTLQKHTACPVPLRDCSASRMLYRGPLRKVT